MLGRLRLQLVGGGDVGDERDVDVERVAAADVLAELPDRLEEGERLDVAHGAADLDDDDVVVGRDAADAVLDLVGDVGDDLDGLAEVVAAPLLLDDGLVDPPGGDAVRLAGDGGGEALVVPEVEVGLGAVVGDEDLAVLERRHRPRVDVEVGVELLEGDLEAAGLEEGRERRPRDPLPEARNDPPVMKTYFVLIAPPLLARQDRPGGSARRRFVFQDPFHRLRVGRRVDPDGVADGGEDGHDEPRGQRAELLEALRPLEGVGREARPGVEGRPAVAVEPQVLPGGEPGLRAPPERDRAPREIERPAVVAPHDLDDVRVGDLGRVVDRPGDGRQRDLRVLQEVLDDPVDVLGVHQRLVPLDVHDDRGVRPLHRGPDPVGSRRQAGGGHHRRPARFPHDGRDPLVVRGDEDGVGPARLQGLPEDPHDERHTCDGVEGLSGEALSAHPGRDHDDRAIWVGHVEW